MVGMVLAGQLAWDTVMARMSATSLKVLIEVVGRCLGLDWSGVFGVGKEVHSRGRRHGLIVSCGSEGWRAADLDRESERGRQTIMGEAVVPGTGLDWIARAWSLPFVHCRPHAATKSAA